VKPAQSGEYQGTRDELVLADPRVRAMFVRPTKGFGWRSDVHPVDVGDDLDAVFGYPDSGHHAEDASRDATPQAWLVAQPGGWTARAITASTKITDRFDRLAADPTDEEVRGFADEFGWLGHPRLLGASIQRADGVRALMFGGGQHHGEPRSSWISEAARFNALRSLFDAGLRVRAATKGGARAPDSVRLIGAHIEWGSGYFAYRVTDQPRGDEGWDEVLRRGTDGATIDRLPRSDWATAADFVVAHEVNRTLRGHVDTMLLPFRRNVMREVPDCLLAAIYLQFANEAATGMRNPRPGQCANPECGLPFSGPSNRMYCPGGTCKDRAKYLVKHPRVHLSG
jgi:hypothetical protein